MLAARQPFGEWIERIIRPRQHRQDRRGRAGACTEGEELRRRQLAVGLHARGAGDDPAPDGRGRQGGDRLDGRRHAARGAVRRSTAALHHFFRQNFSQVTNPPIDSLRETRVMTLKTRLGNLGNILDEDATPVATCCSSTARCCRTPSSRAMRGVHRRARPARSTAPSPAADGEAALRARASSASAREAEEARARRLRPPGPDRRAPGAGAGRRSR